MGVFKQTKNKALAVNEKAAKKVDKQHLKMKNSIKQQQKLVKNDALQKYQNIIDAAAAAAERKITIQYDETKLTPVNKATRVRTVWTEEDDKSLKRYKNQNKSWKKISELLDNKPISACMYRYKNIK